VGNGQQWAMLADIFVQNTRTQ